MRLSKETQNELESIFNHNQYCIYIGVIFKQDCNGFKIDTYTSATNKQLFITNDFNIECPKCKADEDAQRLLIKEKALKKLGITEEEFNILIKEIKG